jgi:hypothetical protein
VSRTLDNVVGQLSSYLMANEDRREKLKKEVERLRQAGDTNLADRIQQDFLDPLERMAS